MTPLTGPLPAEDPSYGDEGPPIQTGDDQREDALQLLTRQQERERNNLAMVLDTPAGRAVIIRILGECRVYASSISFGHADASAFDEGKRAVGLWLIQQLNGVDHTAYPKLLLEDIARARSEQALETGIRRATRR